MAQDGSSDKSWSFRFHKNGKFLKNIFKIFKTQVYNLMKAENVFQDFLILLITFRKIQSRW